jgi:hypothetical protein
VSVRFDAATDKLTYAGSNPPDPASGFTVACWAWVSVDTNANATIVRLHAAGGASTAANGATSTDGLGGPNYFTAGGTVTATTGMAVAAWRTVAWTCTGTTGKVYVAIPGNATEVVSGTVGGAATPTGITVGGRSATDDTEEFNGRLAYVRVWSSVLTQGQIEAEWASTTPVVTSGLWASWPLLTHTDLTDHSGNGRDLVAGGTATTTEADPPLGSVVTGTVAAPLGALTATATGVRAVSGSVAAPLGRPAAAAVGVRTVLGSVAAPLAVTALATGVRATTGTATAALGGLTAHLVQAPAADASTSGGWDTLAAISRENRQMIEEDRSRPLAGCPTCGEPLRTGPRGELYCPWNTGHPTTWGP